MLSPKEETLIAWQEGWKYVFNTMNTLTPEHLLKTVYIRGEAHTVMQAIERQIAHYALHIGQIIYIGKMLKENEWECLSIPRGQSTRSVEKNVQHNNKKETDKKWEKESQPNNRWFCNHKNTAKNKSIYNKKEIEKCIHREKS